MPSSDPASLASSDAIRRPVCQPRSRPSRGVNRRFVGMTYSEFLATAAEDPEEEDEEWLYLGEAGNSDDDEEFEEDDIIVSR